MKRYSTCPQSSFWWGECGISLEQQKGLLVESGDWDETELIYCLGKSGKSFLDRERNVCKGKERGFWEDGIIKGVVMPGPGGKWGMGERKMRPERKWKRTKIEGFCGLQVVWNEEPLMVFSGVALWLGFHGFVYSCIYENSQKSVFHFFSLYLDSAIVVNKIHVLIT